MTPWQWWAGEAENVETDGQYDVDFDTRDEAIAWGIREYCGAPFYVIEARSSEDRRHEESERVPFLRKRNEERMQTPKVTHDIHSSKGGREGVSDVFLIERARTVAARLSEARCWHQAPTSFGRGISTKWFDLNAADVAEAIIRLRELASEMEAETPNPGSTPSPTGEL